MPETALAHIPLGHHATNKGAESGRRAFPHKRDGVFGKRRHAACAASVDGAGDGKKVGAALSSHSIWNTACGYAAAAGHFAQARGQVQRLAVNVIAQAHHFASGHAHAQAPAHGRRPAVQMTGMSALHGHADANGGGRAVKGGQHAIAQPFDDFSAAALAHAADPAGEPGHGAGDLLIAECFKCAGAPDQINEDDGLASIHGGNARPPERPQALSFLEFLTWSHVGRADRPRRMRDSTEPRPETRSQRLFRP